MSRAAVPVLAAAFLCGCLRVSFQRSLGPEETVLQAEVRRHYWEVAAAFAAGDADALAGLFSPAIAHPMTQSQIRDWAREFFAKHGRARFHVTELRFDELGYARAVVTLTYRVEPLGPEGAFGGVETDRLERRGGKWLVNAWDRAPK